ncbi:hexameric tyrosine-coordinated heme protein [Lentibacillus amyloliquefaciens]|uniref:hexameric tyrosine-coordinated heme protein n=1 Tax=Lentibacillus amyloliquefaciens TaxID=1472767 RepID=UPI000ABE2F90|nr:hexameric tyrosine-coordinated heme protein [Lentibacillus amyloliquefaciens]
MAYTQPSAEVRNKLRPEYAEHPDSLTMASHVVAVHFQTVAAANTENDKRKDLQRPNRKAGLAFWFKSPLQTRCERGNGI